MNKQTLTITSEIGNIISVQNFIEQLMNDLPEKLFGRVNLATIEAVYNAIIHGNQSDQTKKVVIETEPEGNKLIISVSDEGDGFDYTHIPDPTIPENRMKTSGRGLYLIRILSDNLEFQHNGSKVIMSFSLKSES